MMASIALFAAAGGGQAVPGGRGLAWATLGSWLVAEALGAYMLRTWIASGGIRDRGARPRGLSPALIFWHAGLAFSGLVSWVSFLATGSPAPAWLAVVLLGPAIGLGISTVTVWTPYPARRSDDGQDHRTHPGQDLRSSAEALQRALASETLASKLVDDLVAELLAGPPPRQRRSGLTALIPAVHGVAALATFLLGTVSAVAAR